jgi:putative membrane protein
MKKQTFAAAVVAAMLSFQVPTFAQQPAKGGADSNQNRGAAADQNRNAAGAGAASDRAAAGGDRTGGDRAGGDRAGLAADRSGAAANNNQQETDRHFILAVASNDQFEIALSNLARERVSNDQVKQFAQRLIEDHQASSQQLAQIAKAAGVEIPKTMNEVHQAELNHLQKLQGRDFERGYVYCNVAGHTKNVLKFRDEAAEAQDQQLKQFAASMLPKLQQHLQQAQQLAGWEGGAIQAGFHQSGAADHHGGATSGSRSGASGAGSSDNTSNRPGNAAGGNAGAGNTGAGNTGGAGGVNR